MAQKVDNEQQQSRFSKGAVIATSRRILKVHGAPGHYVVESETEDNKFYHVKVEDGCDCPDFARRGQTCKHIYAVIYKEVN